MRCTWDIQSTGKDERCVCIGKTLLRSSVIQRRGRRGPLYPYRKNIPYGYDIGREQGSNDRSRRTSVHNRNIPDISGKGQRPTNRLPQIFKLFRKLLGRLQSWRNEQYIHSSSSDIRKELSGIAELFPAVLSSRSLRETGADV